MRTTIQLPDDLHRIATSLARHNQRSLGDIVADLMRRGLQMQAPAASSASGSQAAAYRIDGETGLPVITTGVGRVMTDDDVYALQDQP
ncbi:MAG: hypothetical protein QM569_02145 [Acidovorax sp.]|uniref:hypothetical protein n=1 Tax=Acidovorax sp. TaxID=1872122 RepID=UPI0039E259E5